MPLLTALGPTDLLFVGGVRTSTLAMGAAFTLVGFSLPGRRYRALLGLAAWLFGFETAWQGTSIVVAVLGSPAPANALAVLATRWPLILHQAPVYLLPGPIAILVAWRTGVRVDWRLLGLTAAVWTGWLLAGFHSNGHTAGGFQALDEALNEAAKTAWGMAYLLPLLDEGIFARLQRRRSMIEATVKR
ncbi:MAG TPA: hypothetical protein VG015_01270 [Candidatus Dormibacteraeota bacterium]|jgi:hypothetical protein|nr:hypothetical protein [Candidatus Dormibacteraeota bacterium]